MTLRDHLKKHKLSARAFAARIGVKEATVSRYLSGARVPRWSVLLKIEQETKGEVTRNSFNIMESPRQAAA